MRNACWIPKAIDTHSEYVILIAFPLQQRFHERTSLLRYSTLPVLLNVKPGDTCVNHWNLEGFYQRKELESVI